MDAFLAARSVDDYADFLLPHLAPDCHLLDVGCGDGALTLGLSTRKLDGLRQDVLAGTLPQVSYIVAPAADSDPAVRPLRRCARRGRARDLARGLPGAAAAQKNDAIGGADRQTTVRWVSGVRSRTTSLGCFAEPIGH